VGRTPPLDHCYMHFYDNMDFPYTRLDTRN